MNLTVMISGSCDYLALPYTSPIKHINSSIINKFRLNYITGGYN